MLALILSDLNVKVDKQRQQGVTLFPFVDGPSFFIGLKGGQPRGGPSFFHFVSFFLFLFEGLHVTLMGVEIEIPFAARAFGVAASMPFFDFFAGVYFVTGRASLVLVADRLEGVRQSTAAVVKEMIGLTNGAKEKTVASMAGQMSDLAFVTLVEIQTVGLVTGETFFAMASMFQIIGVKSFFALHTVVDLAKKSTEGRTSMVMLSQFDENELFVFGLRWAFENDLTHLIHGDGDDLILGEHDLEQGNFSEPARFFGNTRGGMKGFGSFFLLAAPTFNLVVVFSSATFLSQCLKRDEGTGTTKLVLVVDEDDTAFVAKRFLNVTCA